MRILLAALAIALLSASAYAQTGLPKGANTDGKATTQAQREAQKKQRAESEQAAKKAIQSLPDKPYDPWQSVRP